MDAGEGASLVAVGEVSTTTITAGASVAAYSGSNMIGTAIDSSADIVVASYGTLQLNNVVAGGNVSLDSVGDLTANVEAEGTLEALTFGNLDGVFEADDDIIEILARGNITGTYSSRDNVDAVFSYEGIDAVVSAGGATPPTDTDGDGYGRVRQVGAWKDIDGTITADAEVVEVVAGGTVLSVVTSPITGDIGDGDCTGFTVWPEPRPPRLGDLRGEFATMEREDQSISDRLGIGRDALDQVLNAVQKKAPEKVDRQFAYWDI